MRRQTRREAVGRAATAAAPPPAAGALTLPRPRSPSRSRRGGSSHPGVGPSSPGRLQPLGTRTASSRTPDPPPTPTPATRYRQSTPHLPSSGACRVPATPATRPKRAPPCPPLHRALRRSRPKPPTPDPESGSPRACAASVHRCCLWTTPLLRVFGAVVWRWRTSQ